MSEVVRSGVMSVVSVAMFVIGAIAQIDGDVAGSALTAGAGAIGLIAVGNMVRAISRTEAQKTEVIDTLQEELRTLHDENRLLRQEIHSLLSPDDG